MKNCFRFLSSYACAVAIITCVSESAAAQTYPGKTVRFLVGFPAGGATDISARAIASKLDTAWKNSVVVENRPGASGVIAAELVKNAPADGYTVLFGSSNEITVRPALVSKMPFDPVGDFAPVSLAIVTPAIIVVHPSVPARSTKELIALAKGKPGELSYAATGPGSPQHLAGELFKILSGTNLVYIPYKGAAPAITDLVGGHVPVGILTMAGTMQYVTAGKLRAIAVTSAKRSAIARDVPTVAEAGLKGFDMNQWFGVFLPRGTPPAIVNQVSKDIAKTLQAPDLRDFLETQALEPVGSTPEEFAKFIAVELTKNAKIVREAGIKIE